MARRTLRSGKKLPIHRNMTAKEKGPDARPFFHSILLPVGLADFIALKATAENCLRQP